MGVAVLLVTVAGLEISYSREKKMQKSRKHFCYRRQVLAICSITFVAANLFLAKDYIDI